MSDAPTTDTGRKVEVPPRIPEDFSTWTPEAQRAWLTGGMTQREMLNFAADELGIGEEFSGFGGLTNRELAVFVVATLQHVKVIRHE